MKFENNEVKNKFEELYSKYGYFHINCDKDTPINMDQILEAEKILKIIEGE